MSSSPTFSSVGGDGEGSRASWESERSFRWNSERDVGAAAEGVVERPSQSFGNSIPRPRPGFVNRHTPTSTVFPASQLDRDQTYDSIGAASSAFADASTPGQSRHQLAAVQASESQSDGFSNSNSQESTSFGGSVTSPLSRFGNPSSHPAGFPALDEVHHDSSFSSNSHSSDNHSDLFHASSSQFDSLHTRADLGTTNEMGQFSSVRLLAPVAAGAAAAHPSTPPSNAASSSSSRPRPRLIPSRERVPTILVANGAHLSPRPSTSTREGEDLDDGDESFVDAEEDDDAEGGLVRQSFDRQDLEGLGYPASSAIYYS